MIVCMHTREYVSQYIYVDIYSCCQMNERRGASSVETTKVGRAQKAERCSNAHFNLGLVRRQKNRANARYPKPYDPPGAVIASVLQSSSLGLITYHDGFICEGNQRFRTRESHGA